VLRPNSEVRHGAYELDDGPFTAREFNQLREYARTRMFRGNVLSKESLFFSVHSVNRKRKGAVGSPVVDAGASVELSKSKLSSDGL
jgi:hypothetical protein